MAGVTELYANDRARLHTLTGSAVPEDELLKAVLEICRDLESDLARLSPAEKEVLCDDLGVRFENELYRAANDRQRRVLVKLLKVVDYQ